MPQRFVFSLPSLCRKALLSWLLAVNVEYLLLTPALRDLASLEGLGQMSLLRVAVMAAALLAVLLLAARRFSLDRAERWGLLLVYACLSALSLAASFSRAYLLVCLLGAVILLVYAILGWNPRPMKPAAAQADRPVWAWIAGILAVGFFLFVSLWTVYRVKTFNVPAYDFGIFVQMFHSMKTTGLPMTTVERDGLLSHFRVHMSPIYYLMLPFYCLVPRPETLQVLQAAVMASAVLPLWKLGRLHGLSGFQRMLLCALLLLAPAFAGGAAYDLHENCFLTPLILWLLYGIDSKNTAVTAVAALLTLCVKEDAAVYVAVIALYLMLRGALRYDEEHREDLLRGGVLLGAALVWFFAATGFLAVVGDGVMSSRYRNFMYDGSSSLITVVKAVLLNPMKALFECADQEKHLYTMLTALPLLGFPLFTRRYERYALLIPYLLINLMSDYAYQHDIFYQYSFGSLALLVYLLAVNLADLKLRGQRTLVLTAAAAISLALFALTNWPYAAVNFKRYETYQSTYLGYQEALSHVPDGVSVTASTHFVAPLAQREIIYSLPHTTRENLLSTQCVVLKTSSAYDFRNFHSEGQKDGYDNLVAILQEEGYEMIASNGSTLEIYLRQE
ncbi:MAG: DUF2079 domain-containing protein [Clostridia bacterium]|nr:DUF2079 domain-containing protein [Clostridia bacterium]